MENLEFRTTKKEREGFRLSDDSSGTLVPCVIVCAPETHLAASSPDWAGKVSTLRETFSQFDRTGAILFLPSNHLFSELEDVARGGRRIAAVHTLPDIDDIRAAILGAAFTDPGIPFLIFTQDMEIVLETLLEMSLGGQVVQPLDHVSIILDTVEGVFRLSEETSGQLAASSR